LIDVGDLVVLPQRVQRPRGRGAFDRITVPLAAPLVVLVHAVRHLARRPRPLRLREGADWIWPVVGNVPAGPVMEHKKNPAALRRRDKSQSGTGGATPPVSSRETNTRSERSGRVFVCVDEPRPERRRSERGRLGRLSLVLVSPGHRRGATRPHVNRRPSFQQSGGRRVGSSPS
jgi:hypothetical protein